MDVADFQKNKIDFSDIQTGLNNIRRYIDPTPLLRTTMQGNLIGIKIETLLPSRSFKIRGTLNALLNNTQDGNLSQEYITASTGNHGIGLAYAAQVLGVKAHVVLYTSAPQQKAEAIRRLGGHVILYGETFDDAETRARELEITHGYHYVSSYESVDVIAGQGTIAIEILTQLPEVTAILVPVGGGGLLGGIALGCNYIAPHVKVIGVQSRSTPSMYNHFYNADLQQKPSLAGGLAGRVDEHSLGLALSRKYAERIILVEEEEIRAAMRWYIFEHGLLIEGSSACAVAALQSGRLNLEDETIAVIASGGNVDEETLKKIVC